MAGKALASARYGGHRIKAAATGSTRSLACEMGNRGITVNAIAPRFIDAELTRDAFANQREGAAPCAAYETSTMLPGRWKLKRDARTELS